MQLQKLFLFKFKEQDSLNQGAQSERGEIEIYETGKGVGTYFENLSSRERADEDLSKPGKTRGRSFKSEHWGASR